MKPKFRLHAHIASSALRGVTSYWTCSVRFATPSTEVLMNSGPCTHARGAIAEAALLMRRNTGHKYR